VVISVKLDLLLTVSTILIQAAATVRLRSINNFSFVGPKMLVSLTLCNAYVTDLLRFVGRLLLLLLLLIDLQL
jgi:hypothetical protein